ncbi:MAG: DUF4132 domain-containing protein [Defluviitaleaceae bacterium]|nr:DUF4132 domain-containing protein [Defluviitaleaceae bacterium]
MQTKKDEPTRNPAIEADFEARAKKAKKGSIGDFIMAKRARKGIAGNFIMALWAYYTHYKKDKWGHNPATKEAREALKSAYTALSGHDPTDIRTLDDFFNPNITQALATFLGEEETNRIRNECELILELPYAYSTYRPSYRSKNAKDYASAQHIHSFFAVVLQSIDFTCYDLPLEEVLTHNWAHWTESRAALALRHNDVKIRALIEEAILGDNNITLSYTLLRTIAKSGNPEALELLGKLLLAAKGQEGLRQSIVETCDQGTLESHIYFLKLILENDMCRFSSIIRAFGTWSGLAYGDQNQKTVEKCMSLALKYLTDASHIEPALNSADTLEIYLALWAISCRDVHSATTHAHRLISAPEKYKRLVGWYFITHTANEEFRHGLAIEYLHIRDMEELAWCTSNLYRSYELNRYNASGGATPAENEKQKNEKQYPHKMFPSSPADRTALFNKLAETAEYIGNKDRAFTESVFPWYTQKLSAEKPCWVMLALAAYDRSPELTRELTKYLHLLDSDQRVVFYTRLLNPKIAEERTALLEGLSDKSQYVRKDTVTRLNFYPMAEPDITRLTKGLTSQSASLRTSIMSVLRKQDEALILPAVDSLLAASNKNQLIAGVELLDVYSTANPVLKEKYASQIAALKSEEKIPQDVLILLEKLGKNEEKTDTSQSLYNPSSPDFDSNARELMRPDIPIIKDRQLKSLIVPNEKPILALYERMAEVLIRNKNHEYEVEYGIGTKQKILLGSSYSLMPKAGSTRQKNGLYHINDYPLTDQWLEAAGEFAKDKIALVLVRSLFAGTSVSNYSAKTPDEWFINLFEGYPVVRNNVELDKKIANLLKEKSVKPAMIDTILHSILHSDTTETDETALFDFALSAYVNLVRKIPQDQLGREFEKEVDQSKRPSYQRYATTKNHGVLSAEYLRYWRAHAVRRNTTDAQFTAIFNELWYQFLASGMQENLSLTNDDMLRAHHMGLISNDAIAHHFSTAPGALNNMRLMTSVKTQGPHLFDKYPSGKEIFDKTLDTVITIEENRGDLPTEVTNLANNIQRFEGGVKHFVNLLAALGTTGFHRGYVYSPHNQNAAISKTTSLSRLLRFCHPTANCTPEALRAALKSAKIPEKRAIQAAIYAPLWVNLLEKALDIPGLKSGVWFFHAHVSENFSVEKETEVGIFAAITTEEFKDGIFDKNWFFDAYNTLGEKRFNELYKNAKYITDSNSAHRRSQLYVDAVLGRLNKDELKAEIIEKRNQEKLRAYALIPLDGTNDDALTRYDYIQRYKKESREYGSARQASEGRAAEIALDNLAITTGYDSTDRMIWALEGAKIDQLRPLMSPHAIDEIEAWLEIAEDGTPELALTKKGKPLKTVPKAVAKNEIILEIKNAVKELKGQKSRARYSFEAAMISRATFTPKEITGLLTHPVLGGMMSTLVLKYWGILGFPSLAESPEGPILVITAPDGTRHDKPPAGTEGNTGITIAHPHDFMENGVWSSFQQYIFREKITQPFKQVFREYYPITQDEKDAVNISRRYAGHQVQPKKTVALLKTRGWTADYEAGLQRVWHKQNIIVRMYAMADWFSPGDVEAPTLEGIQFFSRDKGAPLAFADIPAVIFSETMRDIDLVVSVAHAGGVDPEASHSTIEMRVAIARELLAMLRVDNVTFKTAHAIVAGSMGEYSVHMGSGVMHMTGAGMLAVLPVHSQARGRIFLPFADEDPRTAEILAKILLFADDTKIKDPSILEQIKR